MTQRSLFQEDSEGLIPSRPLILLLGNVDYEGITSPLKMSGEQYKKKLLESKAANWDSILKYFDRFTTRAVIVKLTGRTYELLATPDYASVAHELFSAISHNRHIVFVFEDLLRVAPRARTAAEIMAEGGPLDPYEKEDLESQNIDGFHHPAKAILSHVNQMLRDHDLNLVPYLRNAELTVAATQFLRDALEGLLFRVYVPTGRLWAKEVDRLLQLFREYLETTGRKGIRLEQIRTDRGISYEFHGDESLPGSLSSEFQDFSRFLDLCILDQGMAAALLKDKNLDKEQISEILVRYSKEARRLQTDLRHERERKLLSIRQRLESELTDVLPPGVSWANIDILVRKAIPEALSIESIARSDSSSPQLISGIPAATVINVNAHVIESISGIVAQEIRGDAGLTDQDRELLSLIRLYANKNSVELTSAVHTLSDPSIPKSNQLSGAQKLKSFLFAIGTKIGDASVTLLEHYIEKQLGI